MRTPTPSPKERRWQAPAAAERYEKRRFHSPLGRRRQRRDERRVRALLEQAGVRGRVLDVPCGTGRLVPALAGGGLRVVGVDLSAAMLAARSWRLSPSDGMLGLVRGSADRTPFRDDAFAAAICVRFLFHVEPRERRIAMLTELGRVAALVVGQVRYRRTAKHLGRWVRSRVGLAARYRSAEGPAGIAAELAEAGLELLRLQPVSSLFSDKAFFVARRAAGQAIGRPRTRFFST